MSPGLASDLARRVEMLEIWEHRFIDREAIVRAFVDEPERFARVRSEAAREGPFAGLLLGVKDVFHVTGLPTRAGSDLPVSELRGEQGPCVTALRAAGAIVAGKTVTTEFAYFAPGPTRNPVNPAHTPGGSSSGSAAAVAAELCDLALGTQTIGSIGRPAAYCGVVGFKPSSERISRIGLLPLAPSLDHVGMLARDVATIAAAAPLVAADWRAPEGEPAKPRLAVPAGPYLEHLEPAGKEHFARARARLAGAGFEIAEVAVMADFAAVAERHRRLVAFECARVHTDWYARYGELYAAKTVELIRRGLTISEADAERDRAGRLELRAALASAQETNRFDLWLSPPAPGPAPEGLASTGDPVMNLPWTHAGVPTLVLPAGRSDVRFGTPMPMGIQLAGEFGDDERLLAWGTRIEAALSEAAEAER